VKIPPKAGQRLIAPAIVAAALVAVGMTAVIGGHQFLERTRAEQAKAAADRAAAQNKLARATDEEREIRETLVHYQKLRNSGLIGEEQREDWVDRLGQIKAKRKLFDVKYAIDAQRPVDYPGIAGAGDVEFLASTMRLDLALLHEEDLFRFLDDLRGAVRSHVVVRSCTMQRLEVPPTERMLAPRLRAECTVDLVTIRDRKAKTT
jgi:hypothetical protein